MYDLGDTSQTAAEGRGGAFYDNDKVFERYRTPPRGVSNPNEVMEGPALTAELGAVEGLRVVDLGCGDAAIGRQLLSSGCRSYLGIDGSHNMVQAARATLAGTSREAVLADIEDYAPPPGAFDSRLALHYVEDLARTLNTCRSGLVTGGRVVFTVVHPVITSHDARSSIQQLRTDWLVDDYFVAGPREQHWLTGKVVWYHRTIEEYVSTLSRAGFALTSLRECPPQPDLFPDPAEYERRRRIPLFLLLSGTAY